VGLTAAVALSSEQLDHPSLWDIHVELRNDGPEPLRLSTATMHGAVSFEVVDAAGRRVPLGPPPVPPADLAAGLTTIGPGATLSLRFHGDELFADAPPPGRYELRFAARAPAVDGAWEGLIVSPWRAFSVGA
jgi:hypothetical protein